MTNLGKTRSFIWHKLDIVRKLVTIFSNWVEQQILLREELDIRRAQSFSCVFAVVIISH